MVPSTKDYFVLDHETDLILLAGATYELANFVGSAMRNAQAFRLEEEPLAYVEKMYAGIAATGGVLKHGKDGRFSVVNVADLTRQVRARLEQADMYATGYRYLHVVMTSVAAQYEHTCSLEIEDLALYAIEPESYAALFSKVRGIPVDEARKQLQFDYKNMVALQLRRKELLWTHGAALKGVTTRSKLEQWKTTLRDSVVGVGQV